MELDVPTHSYNVLNEHLQGSDKQREIELYYELLSSGRSVGEILDALGPLQCKSEHGNITTAVHPSSRVDRVAPGVTSEAALMGVAPANTQRILGLATPVEAESGRTGGARLSELGSGDRLKVAGESFPGSETNIDRSADVHAAVSREIKVPPGNRELRQPGKFSVSAKRFAIGALYTVAVASASIASFAYVNGDPNADLTTTRVQSGISSGAEAVAIQASAADGSETVDESLEATKQAVSAHSLSAPESSKSADPHSAVPGSLQGEVAKVSITFPESTSNIGQMEESSFQVKDSAFKNRDAVGSGTGRPGDVSVPIAKEIRGQQIVRAFYTALERGDGEAASVLVIPEKREAGPFSAGELSRFYGRLEMPLRLLEVDRAGDNLYNVLYSYKVRNGRFCNGRSLVTTITLQNQALIEKIQSTSRC
jgi:hypothetical protein